MWISKRRLENMKNDFDTQVEWLTLGMRSMKRSFEKELYDLNLNILRRDNREYFAGYVEIPKNLKVFKVIKDGFYLGDTCMARTTIPIEHFRHIFKGGFDTLNLVKCPKSDDTIYTYIWEAPATDYRNIYRIDFPLVSVRELQKLDHPYFILKDKLEDIKCLDKKIKDMKEEAEK